MLSIKKKFLVHLVMLKINSACSFPLGFIINYVIIFSFKLHSYSNIYDYEIEINILIEAYKIISEIQMLAHS